MKFRPCIDIHNGKVKQIVGGSLRDQNDFCDENFVSLQDASFYAKLYQQRKLVGGHIILLNSKDSEFYKATKAQALLALKAYPNGLQIGGGITAENAKEFIEAGASHVIVTSYVFQNGKINYDRLEELVKAVGKEHVVLDLSCRKKNGLYYIVTERWQNYTDEVVNSENLNKWSQYCNEFLIHAVDVEGKSNGVEQELLPILGEFKQIPITYAGGIHSYHDLNIIEELGNNQLDFTIGSSLDLFGGSLPFENVVNWAEKMESKIGKEE